MTRGDKRRRLNVTSPAPVATSRRVTRPFLASLVVASSALAAGAPENAVIFVNGDSWASLAIANEYRALRDIASEHLIVLHDLPSFERMNVDDFREKILKPGLQEVEKRGLAAQLDYVLYSADFPTAIDVSADMAGKTFPQQITQPASITGLTYLYKFVMAKNPSYLGLNTNFYFRQIAKTASAETLPPEDLSRYTDTMKRVEEITRRFEEARKASNGAADFTVEDKKALGEALKNLSELRTKHPKHSEVLYNTACLQARLGQLGEAVATLREAMDHGWFDMRHAQQDPDLRALRERADFKELANRAKDAKFDLWPTSGFRGNVGWMPTGQPVPFPQGLRYLLSASLAYTSGRGMSVSSAIAGLARSAKVDGTRPAGTIYFLENDDIRSTTREWGFRRATEKLREVGVTAKVEKGILPANKPDVMGLTMGAADFSWAQSGSNILPGAICDHLTSCGGMLHEGDPQTPLTEFLRNGAAGASGTVHEPYAIQAKFPNAFAHYHYAQGCTLAEAFYQSVAGPYQLLIVGDALCNPWKKRLDVNLPDLRAGITVQGKIKVTPGFSSPDRISPTHFDLFLDGKRIAAAKLGDPLEFDSAAVADGPREMQIVANGNDAMATTGRLVFQCTVKNGTTSLNVETKVPAEVAWDKDLEIKASAPGAKHITFRQAGREIAKIDSADGTAKMDLRRLGPGPVLVQPIASFDGGHEHLGAPLRFRIVAPAPLPAITLPEGKKLTNGFHVIAGTDTPVIVAKAEGDWLAKAGVKGGTKFAVEGWFNVDENDTYQFQLKGPTNLAVSVDGVPQTWSRGKEWWYVPVALAKGLHRVKIEGTAEGTPALDARFGGPGSYRFAGERFQHLE